MLGKEKKSYSIQSVNNVLTLLEAFSEIDGEVRVSHLSELLGMNKSHVFRLLATLEQRGYVEKGEKSTKYRLGLSAYEMGQKFLSRMDFLKKAKPVMTHLARQCDEAVYLAVARNHEVLLLGMVDTTQVVGTIPLVGNSYPDYQTAAGKVILAFTAARGRMDDEELPAQLAEELALIRQKRFGVDYGGVGEGIACLAVPVFDGQSKPPGSLCIVGPEFRFDEKRIDNELFSLLKEAGKTLSSKLGYHLSNAIGVCT